MAFRDDIICFNPRIPEGLNRMEMKIKYRGNWFDIIITPGSMEIASSRGELQTANIAFGGKVYELSPGKSLSFDVKK